MGPHFGYIFASYAISIIAILGLLIWVVRENRQLKRELETLEPGGRDS